MLLTHQSLENEKRLRSCSPPPRRLRAQLGLPAFFKRLFLLHASKLVALLAFAAAMQSPGGLGLGLAVGVVAFPPALGPVRSENVYRRGALLAALAGAQLLAAAWMLAQYSVEVQWVKVRQRRRWLSLSRRHSPFPFSTMFSYDWR